LDDIGIGGYAQGTLVAWDKLELGLGLRADYERKEADIRTFYSPMIAPGTAVDTDADFTHISPQFSLAWHVVTGKTLYGVVSRGYRAGGFNPDSPTGKTAYDQETSWHYEIGAKTTSWDGRFTANLALFYIDWQDLQLNLPYGRNYYVANAGAANSKGVELELNLRPVRGWDVFGGVGYTDGHFNSGAVSMGPVGGNRLIFTPDFTANAGTQVSVELCPKVTAYARAEVIGTGKYFYDAANTAAQDAYWLANFRVGLRLKQGFIEGWIKNAFDQNYVPVAFPYPSASGFLGECGAPMTCGIRAGMNF
jgi:iron complex outermembrane receptor protein